MSRAAQKPLSISLGSDLILTDTSMDVFIEYYNEKYPARPKINHVKVNIKSLSVSEVSDGFMSEIKMLHKSAEPLKMVFALYQDNGVCELLYHATPIIITDRKLIFLRDEKDFAVCELLQKVAQGLGLEIVEQVETEIGLDIEEDNSSFQYDRVSCGAIAVGILKDIDNEDIAKISDFDTCYTPLPKMLKYSQSTSYLRRFSEELLKMPVKESGESLGEYVVRNKVAINSSGVPSATTRIVEKVHSFFSKIPEGLIEAGDAKIIAERVIARSGAGRVMVYGGAGRDVVDAIVEEKA